MTNPLDVNLTTAARHLTVAGSNWLWVVTGIMGVSALVALVWSRFQPCGARTFHHIAVAVLSVSSIAYFAMASNLGQTPCRTEFRNGPDRSIFYVRYIQWFINAPLILLALFLTTGLPLSEIFLAIFFILVAVVDGLVGALTPTCYKWVFYGFGTLALLYVISSIRSYALLCCGLKSRLCDKRMYRRWAGYTAVIWLLYPVCWALSEGANILTVNHEMVFYGVLDLLAGPLFFFVFLTGLRDADYDAFGLQSGKASDCVDAPGRPPEKCEDPA
ncbi:hypothetical protein BJV78DRAFT_1122819 [Lactifluus subvellereus]|nr:hypothetical protein BJV78DRAFT_1122819 [Lactifluus subvellereus]